jgi:hypothetical protein
MLFDRVRLNDSFKNLLNKCAGRELTDIEYENLISYYYKELNYLANVLYYYMKLDNTYIEKELYEKEYLSLVTETGEEQRAGDLSEVRIYYIDPGLAAKDVLFMSKYIKENGKIVCRGLKDYYKIANDIEAYWWRVRNSNWKYDIKYPGTARYVRYYILWIPVRDDELESYAKSYNYLYKGISDEAVLEYNRIKLIQKNVYLKFKQKELECSLLFNNIRSLVGYKITRDKIMDLIVSSLMNILNSISKLDIDNNRIDFIKKEDPLLRQKFDEESLSRLYPDDFKYVRHFSNIEYEERKHLYFENEDSYKSFYFSIKERKLKLEKEILNLEKKKGTTMGIINSFIYDFKNNFFSFVNKLLKR